MEQAKMEHWEMDNEKVIKSNFLNGEVEEFTTRCSQNLVNVRRTSYLKQKLFKYCLWVINRLYIKIFPRT